MAKSYPTLDHTSWPSCLPAPSSSCWPHGGAAWFSTATFENDALAYALVRASMPRPTSPTTSTTTTSSVSELSSFIPPLQKSPLTGGTPVAAASGAAGAQARRHTTGRVTKRKPRPSRRAPVTYITADPADFRRMVQDITGFQSPVGAGRVVESSAAPPCSSLAFVLPTLDTSASFLIDRAPAPSQPEEEQDGASWCRAATASSEDDWSLALMQELEATMCAPLPSAVASSFPTLDSWGRGMI